jgi:G3E family GTPase
MPARTPVFVLTGFLGSGKTTLLRALLAHPGMGDTAVVVNELGEVGLDHLLVREVTEEVVLLASGCVCCTVRDDLATTIEELHALGARGAIPAFSRIVVETTGLADPAPIVHALAGVRAAAARTRLAGLTATVDATFGWRQLDEHPEALKQAAIADRLVITKTELAGAGPRQALEARLRALNPAARLARSAAGRFPAPEALFDPAGDFDRVAAGALAPVYPGRGLPRSPAGHHDRRIANFVVRIEQPVDWTSFREWLELLLAARGDSLLRVKGLVHAAGKERPLVIQCVQHLVYPPAELAAWPDADRATRLVFITRDLTRSAVLASLAQVLGDAVLGAGTDARHFKVSS